MPYPSGALRDYVLKSDLVDLVGGGGSGTPGPAGATGATGPAGATGPGIGVNVTASPYNAVGNGVTNDTLAIQAAIDAVSAAGGGIVYVPPGVYAFTALNHKSNVILRGGGAPATRLLSISTTNVYNLYCNAINGWGVEDIAIQGSTTIDFTTVLQVEGCTDGRISNVRLIGGTHAACQIGTTSSRIKIDTLYITGVGQNSGGTGGVGLWLYRNATDNEVTNLVVDTTRGSGLSLDAGTSDGLGVVVQRNTLTNVVLRNTCTHLAGKAIEVEGASRNTITGLVIDTVGAAGVSGQGVQLNRDQAGISSDHNIFSGFTLRNLTFVPINLISGTGNVFTGGTITMFNTLNLGSPQAITLQSTTNYSGADVDDNKFSNITIDATGGGTYTYGVLFAASGARHAFRNLFEHMTWGSPSGAIAGIFDPEANVPVQGANRNKWQAIGVESATSPALATSGTVAAPIGLTVSRVAPAADVTGVILEVGVEAGQSVVVLNEATYSIAFAAAGTSHVSTGTSCVIPGLTHLSFVWDSVTSLWYPAAVGSPVFTSGTYGSGTYGTGTYGA